MNSKHCLYIFYALLVLWPLLAPFTSSAQHRSNSTLQAEYLRSVAIRFPDDNPYATAKFELGKMLFFDPLLSGSGSRSCASCHNPGLSWGDGLARAVGDNQAKTLLRAPTLLNVAWTPRLGWDGKFADIEAVTFAAITGARGMNLPEGDLVQRLSANPAYARAFAEA